MSPPNNQPMMREVNLTTARNLSPIFTEAVRNEHPVLIVRGRHERGVLLSQEAVLRLLAPYQFQVNVIPEDNDGFTLWLREVNVAATGPSLKEARDRLLSVIRSYVRDYFEHFDFYRHLPDLASQEPYIVRLSLAKDDAELIALLFRSSSPELEPEPEKSSVAKHSS